LLTNQWSHDFEAYQKAIGNLDLKMHKLGQFLKAKFDVLKPQIAAEIASACVFENCGVCGFKAARIDEIGETLHESKCKVCAAERRLLFIDCPRCTAQIRIEDMAEGQCAKCGVDVDINDLVEAFGVAQDRKEPNSYAYCSECFRTDTETVVPYGDGYLCLSCLTEHDSADNCRFCNALCTGIDPVTTSGFGCLVCEGSLSLDHT
jgi:hypothetical protein